MCYYDSCSTGHSTKWHHSSGISCDFQLLPEVFGPLRTLFGSFFHLRLWGVPVGMNHDIPVCHDNLPHMFVEKRGNGKTTAIHWIRDFFVEQLHWPPVPSYAKGSFFGSQVTVSETFSAKKSESFVPWLWLLLLAPLEVPQVAGGSSGIGRPLGGGGTIYPTRPGWTPTKIGCLNDVFLLPLLKSILIVRFHLVSFDSFCFRGVLVNCHSSKEQWMFCLRIYFMNLFPPPKN